MQSERGAGAPGWAEAGRAGVGAQLCAALWTCVRFDQLRRKRCDTSRAN